MNGDGQGGATRVGFIGVGLMGHGMARNILDKGHPLTVMGHRNRAPVEDLVGRGAREAATPAELAAASDVVFLCVTASPEIESLVRRPDGLKSAARPGLIIVDCSTADPSSTIALAAELKPLGVAFVDAPLGGTPAQAQAGQLSAMVGADAEVFERVKPVIETWAAKVSHVGPVGDGHKMKLINNFISMGYAAIYAEALTMAKASGITPRVVDAVIRGGRMDCGFYQTYFRWVLDRDPEAHRFTLRNAFKDMRYVQAMAEAGRIANPLGNAVRNAFALAVAGGRGDDFVPMLSDVIAELNGQSLVDPAE